MYKTIDTKLFVWQLSITTSCLCCLAKFCMCETKHIPWTIIDLPLAFMFTKWQATKTQSESLTEWIFTFFLYLLDELVF